MKCKKNIETYNYFNEINKSYFKLIRSNNNYVELQSNNTKHYWIINAYSNRVEILHRHSERYEYHKERWRPTSIDNAVKLIISHDIFQMNHRRKVDNDILAELIEFYMRAK
ncbi:hypothetical protein SAMN04487830_107114 [Pseudobutyrivibrio sp. OR37]|nr:hypothetical protein SAMN04487830_107114 [Pseudobutyrivibrio sp. OR37]